MIQVKGLTKTFATGKRAVDGLDLSVKEGEIFGLLGPNGAGKTTTIRVLATLCGFEAGEVTVAGYNVDEAPDKVRATIGVVAQNTGIDYFLTGRENLMLQGRLYHMEKGEILARIAELAKYFELEEALDRLVSMYSGGMRRKLDIATALIHKPRVIFLDEPTLGLDIKSRKSLWTYINKLNEELGLTILLTTHYLEEADQLADRIAIINAGKINVVDTPEVLKEAIHGDALVLTFAQDDDAMGTFFWNAKQQPFVKNAFWKNDKLYLYVENGAADIPRLAVLAEQQGVKFKTLSLSRPTLDDVFLKYTGTSLEEPKEEAGDEWWKQWAGKGGGGKWAKAWQDSQAAETTETADSGTAWPGSGQWSGGSNDGAAQTPWAGKTAESPAATEAAPTVTEPPPAAEQPWPMSPDQWPKEGAEQWQNQWKKKD